MTPDELQREIYKVRVLALLNAVDISSLLTTIAPNPHEAISLQQRFLARRKELLHELLLQYEQTDPAYAAHLQAYIDQCSKQYPFDFT